MTMRARLLLAAALALSASCSLVRNWDDLSTSPPDGGAPDAPGASCTTCPDTLATATTTPLAVAVADGIVFWSEIPSATDRGRIRARRLDGADAAAGDLALTNFTPSAIAPAGGRAWWLGSDEPDTLAIAASCAEDAGCIVTWDGVGAPVASPPDNLLTAQSGWLVDAIVVDSAAAYWTVTTVGRNAGTGLVASCAWPCSGGAPAVYAADQPTPRGIAVDDTYLYWVTADDGVLHRVAKGDPDAGPPENLAGDLPEPGEIALYGDWIYVASTANGGAILRAPKAGGPSETVATSQAGAQGIAADATGVYWTTYLPQGAIATCAHDGCANGPRVVARAPSAWGIALDDTYVYFTSRQAGGAVARIPKTARAD